MKQFLLLSLLLAPSAAFTAAPKQRATTSTSLFSSSTEKKKSSDFVQSFFASSSDCDNVNTPPSLSETLASMEGLANGSDIRGVFCNHKRVGSFAAVSSAIRQQSTTTTAVLTPFAAHCLGHAFGQMVQERYSGNENENDDITVCIGNDPREHGPRLADAFSRGCSSTATGSITVKYTGIATTPSVMDFCRSGLCNAGVVLTASHLPQDRNGMKFFDANQGGWTKQNVQELLRRAKDHAQHEWSSRGILPPTSGTGGVYCSEWVDYMPIYAQHLSDAICQQVGGSSTAPLEGLKIVLNSGNGAGGFFNQVLKDLGADVSDSMNIDPNSSFPHGVPNPENADMVQATMDTCQRVEADLGILLDTDADRSGFIAPNMNGEYEAVHKNRLIALLGVLFAETSPGCTVVTDSCTSEGLQVFLEQKLGLHHERYVKGYANVIRKAKELTNDSNDGRIAEMAIETSGHCAMKENDYLDDGTYTAVKVISLLAKISKDEDKNNLLDLIGDLQEMEEVIELRMTAPDMPTMLHVFDECESAVQEYCETNQRDWTVDTDNLEGIRVRTGNGQGGFFMVRKSLHDPVMIVQVEGDSADQVRSEVVAPLLKLFERHAGRLDMTSMQEY